MTRAVSQTPTNLNDLIQEAAADPARARDQAMEVQSRSLTELIEADKHLRRTKAAANPFAAVRRARIKHGRPGGLP